MTITEDAPAGHVGSRRLRKEDPALLTGEAKFIDDLALPGAIWVGVVRSTEPTPTSSASTARPRSPSTA